ncbi:MAG TPA: sulfatase-like hydrolase/transferase [Polyangia bacterium]|jgi:hypothetical protein
MATSAVLIGARARRAVAARIRPRALVAWRPAAWLTLSVGAAVVASLLDALLLERKMGLFRGGFLANAALPTLGGRLAFAAVSLCADVALVAPLAGLALMAARRVRLGAWAGRFVALAVALVPIAAFDFVSYELASFLGAGADLSLMFQLVRLDVRELLAVGGSYLLHPAGIGLCGALVLALVTWRLHRVHPAPEPRRRASWRARLGVAAALVGCVAVMTAGRVASEAIDTGLRHKASGALFGLLVTTVTDVDRDGYGLLQLPPDPAPLDARVHPYALDVPGNGIDEDGVGGDLPAAASHYAEGPAAPPPWRARPDVVLILLESVRADAVGARLGGRPITPVLDALAARGITARHAYSHNGFTYQSRFHLLSGSVINGRGGTTLIDDFKRQGYRTAYISGQDESFGGQEFAVGFDRAEFVYHARTEPQRRFTAFATPGSIGLPFTVVEEQVERMLAAGDERPLFTYVNLYDTHFPYRHDGVKPLVTDISLVTRGKISRGSAAAIVPGRREELRAMYLNTMSNVDRAIGAIVAAVTRARGRAPAVIVTSDHGESLFEGGFLGHGYALNEAQTRVPLVVSGLGMAVHEPLGHAEVRDLIWEALSRDPAAQAPTLVQDPERRVFQYIGELDRPRRIGWRTLAGQVVYDFKAGTTLEAEGGPERLARGAVGPAVPLIQRWEAMMLARAARRQH